MRDRGLRWGVLLCRGNQNVQFPVRVRYVGSSVAYTFAGVFAGGLAPLAFTRMYQAGNETGPIVAYAAIALIITVVALLASRRD